MPIYQKYWEAVAKFSVAIVGIILNQWGLNLPNPRHPNPLQIEHCTRRVRKRDLIMGFCCMQRPQQCPGTEHLVGGSGGEALLKL